MKALLKEECMNSETLEKSQIQKLSLMAMKKIKQLKLLVYYIKFYCFKFISCLVIIFWRIMGFTKSFSDQLQREELDFAMAADLIKSTSDTLRTLRSEDTWDQTYQYITSVATIHNIVIEEPRQRRQTRRPQRMDDFVCMSSSGQRESLTSI